MLVHTMHPPTWGVWGGRPELVLNLFTISASDFGETAQCELLIGIIQVKVDGLWKGQVSTGTCTGSQPVTVADA